ncbi:hypothetical protein MANES_07G139800v8 [Manihot esculenta]|uniref:Uncharacterized protein n=1 Tax=Manihot esculenta TaxID=3983 RepID=A0A2C9VLC0_MANES|nr:hypothetical protein MANES_07G139800v8 [Manihot esculenta]
MAKASALLLTLVLLMSLMFQCKVATRIGKDCAPACLVERRGTEKHLDMEDDSGDESGQGDYDYYRRYGDVPSPGIGH